MSAPKPLTAIPKGFGSGGAGLSPNGGGSSTVAGPKPTLEQLLNEHKAAILALQGEAPDAFIVRAATTANITRSAPQTIDGVAVIAGDKVLVKDQSTPAQNGVYTVAAGAWTLATDDSGGTLLKEGELVAVSEGTANGSKLFVLASDLTTWNAGTTASLSSATPAAVGAAGAAGSAGTASKSDHVHADPMRAAAGANLGDADANIQISGGTWRKLPAATLTADRTYTLVTTGAIAGDQIDITRNDATAHAAIFVNGGAGAGTLLTMPNSKVNSARFQFDGTNWALRLCGTQ